MIVDCIADLHGYQPALPGGDLLILAGGYTKTGNVSEWADFFHWVKKQEYISKIVVAGNQDNLFDSGFPNEKKEMEDWREIADFLDIDFDFEYLCDSGTEFGSLKKSLKIWGTPWTPTFENVNPHCTAFMRTEEFLEEKFNLIPNDLDILITHGPMHLMLDKNKFEIPCGSKMLRKAVLRAKPKFHIFGHIHEQGNKKISCLHTTYINCSYVNDRYEETFNYMRIII